MDKYIKAGLCTYDYDTGAFERLSDDCPVIEIVQSGKTIKAVVSQYRALGYDKMPKYLFGTDYLGRDLTKLAFKGLQSSLVFAVIISSICFLFGLVWGAVSGYFGGNVDLLMERFTDILGNIPGVVIVTLFRLHLVKDIKADKYTNNLFVRCLNDYYDTTYYKGLDILGNQITVNVTEHPKGTKYYKYYLNNELKATTEEQVHVFTGLTVATTYTYKVEAVNENDEVIKSVTNTVKTKCFKTLNAERVGDNFKVKITGIDSRVNAGFCALWHENSNQKFTYPTINSDRSIDLSFNAYEVDGIKSTGHYYFHLQLYNYSDSNFNEIICMNIMFFDNNSAVGDPEKIDPNNLNKNGNYEITVIDLAGNKTTKCCTIQI